MSAEGSEMLAYLAHCENLSVWARVFELVLSESDRGVRRALASLAEQ